MKRRNPAAASSPNPQFEMTSFMDIIFIFLFVVMVGYALKCANEREAAEDKMAEADARFAEAEAKVAEAQAILEEAGEKAADIAVYEQQIKELKGAVVGNRVQIVTITCTYDADNDKSPSEWMRHMRVLGGDLQMLLSRDYAEDASASAYDKLREVLKKYVDGVKKAESQAGAGTDGAAKQDRVVVVFAISREEGGILTRDYEAIMGIIEEMEKAYEDVY